MKQMNKKEQSNSFIIKQQHHHHHPMWVPLGAFEKTQMQTASALQALVQTERPIPRGPGKKFQKYFLELKYSINKSENGARNKTSKQY